jgi:hypothetical protein
MARIPTAKLELLKKAYIEDAMSPGQAADKVGVTYASAKRYYDKWAPEIKQRLESRLIPEMQESIKQLAKKRRRVRPASRAKSKR